jgi:hypothetical protein
MLDAGHEPTNAAWALLRRLALSVPGAHHGHGSPDPAQVVKAAAAETAALAAEDTAVRRGAADRARAELTDPVRLLFGN